MAKKKSSQKGQGASLQSRWASYFGKGALDDFQRLCRDLGLPDDLPSKTQCRKVRRYIPGGCQYTSIKLTMTLRRP